MHRSSESTKVEKNSDTVPPKPKNMKEKAEKKKRSLSAREKKDHHVHNFKKFPSQNPILIHL